MKIRKMGWTTFVLSTDNISVATDPIYDGKSINGKVEADVILLTNYEKDVKKGIIIDNGLQNKIWAPSIRLRLRTTTNDWIAKIIFINKGMPFNSFRRYGNTTT